MVLNVLLTVLMSFALLFDGPHPFQAGSRSAIETLDGVAQQNAAHSVAPTLWPRWAQSASEAPFDSIGGQRIALLGAGRCSVLFFRFGFQ
jgi:hypothetical protein